MPFADWSFVLFPIPFSLQPFPNLDLQNGFFRAWWFDPLVATVSFAVFINWYWYHERRLGLSSVQKLSFHTLDASSQPVKATIGYWIGVYLWRLFIPAAGNNQLPDGIPFSMHDVLYLVMEVVAGLVLYDAIFFFIHMAMHQIPWLRKFHWDHHDISKGTLESRDVLRHSIVDAVLQVWVNIMVQRHTPWGAVKSRLARAVHNVLVIWFLVESHAAAPVPYIWRRWLVGVREHRKHHLGTTIKHHKDDVVVCIHSTNHRYQQFFGYLDDLKDMWFHMRVHF